MALIEERYGKERAQTDGRFKKEREAWATAIYGLALSKWYGGRQYWIEIETVDDTPDNRLHYLDATADGNMLETIPVEVVDWEQHSMTPSRSLRKSVRVLIRATIDSWLMHAIPGNCSTSTG